MDLLRRELSEILWKAAGYPAEFGLSWDAARGVYREADTVLLLGGHFSVPDVDPEELVCAVGATTNRVDDVLIALMKHGGTLP
jgi:hypothetical protein